MKLILDSTAADQASVFVLISFVIKITFRLLDGFSHSLVY